jgi:hypothetical protein
MNPGYYLVGFDRLTEWTAEFHALPVAVLSSAMQTAGLTPEVAVFHGDWPVSDDATHEIAALIGAIVDTETMTYCLEPYAPIEPAEFQPKAAE